MNEPKQVMFNKNPESISISLVSKKENPDLTKGGFPECCRRCTRVNVKPPTCEAGCEEFKKEIGH